MLTQKQIDEPKWTYRCPSCGYRSDMDMIMGDTKLTPNYGFYRGAAFALGISAVAYGLLYWWLA